MKKESALKPGTELQEHQQRLVERAKDTPGMLLYWGTGSGKSLGSLAATEGKKTDVVVPAALRENYKKEIAKHTDKKTSRAIHSYESAAKNGLTGGDALVVDEVQRINNSSSARTKAIMEAAPKYKQRFVLSGTPIRNHPSEIAPIIKTVDPHSTIPLDPKAFSERYISERKVSPGIINRLRGLKPGIVHDVKNLKEFRQHIHGKVDYHMPEQEGYPTHAESIKHVPMSKEQTQIYDTVTSQANPILARKVRSNLPLSKQENKNLNAFMQGARGVSNTATPYGGKGRSPKIDQVASDIEEGIKKNPRFKSVTYSNYLEAGSHELSKALHEKNISHGVFHGGLSDKARAKLVDDYNTDKIKSLVISGAGAEGIDLKGTRLMQIMEPHWNKARLDQAKGRAIRYQSHDHLPENERHVDVVHYHSVRPKTLWHKVLGGKPGTAADEYLHNLSGEKQKLNDKFLDVLKEEGLAHHKTGSFMSDTKLATLVNGFEKQASTFVFKKLHRSAGAGAALGGAIGATIGGIGGAVDAEKGEHTKGFTKGLLAGGLGGSLIGGASGALAHSSIKKKVLDTAKKNKDLYKEGIRDRNAGDPISGAFSEYRTRTHSVGRNPALAGIAAATVGGVGAGLAGGMAANHKQEKTSALLFAGFEKKASFIPKAPSRLGSIVKEMTSASKSEAGKNAIQKVEQKVVNKTVGAAVKEGPALDYSTWKRPHTATDGKIKPMGYKGG